LAGGFLAAPIALEVAPFIGSLWFRLGWNYLKEIYIMIHSSQRKAGKGQINMCQSRRATSIFDASGLQIWLVERPTTPQVNT
jgi:hypothetical protein